MKRSLKSSLRWLFAERFLRLVATVPVTIWTARVLAPEEFGRLGFALGLASVAIIMAQSGIERMVRRDLSERPHDAGVILGTSIGLTAAFAILGALAVTLYGHVIVSDAHTREILLLLAWGGLPQMANPMACWFQSVGHPRPVVIARSGVVIGCGVLRAVACFLQSPVEAFVWITLAEWSATSVWIYLSLRRTPEAPRNLSFGGAQAVAWLREGGPTITMVLLTSFFERLDLILLERLSPPSEMGYLIAAQRFSELWWSMSTLAAIAFLPWLSEAKRLDPKLYSQRVQRYADVSVMLTVTVALGATLLGPFVLPPLLGAAYAPSTGILILLCWTAIPVFLETMRTQYFVVERKQNLDVAFNLINMMLLTLLALLWVPEHGAVGLVFARLVSFFAIVWVVPLLFPSAREMAFQSWRAFGFALRLRELIAVLKLFLQPKKDA